SVRALIASLAPRGSCAWTARSRSATPTASRAGGPVRSCAANRSSSASPSSGPSGAPREGLAGTAGEGLRGLWRRDGKRRSFPQCGQELCAAEHPLELLAPLVAVEPLDARVGRVARHLLDAEVPVGEARDLRQVRDRDHLC